MSFLGMSSKRKQLFEIPLPQSKEETVRDEIRKKNKKIDHLKGKRILATNEKQVKIIDRKIGKLQEEIRELTQSLSGIREEPKKKKRKVYIEDPD